MKRASFALPLVLAVACSHATARRAVTVEGWASRGPQAERRAVFDALKRAVEQAGGVRVDARSRVSLGIGMDARIVARATGCVIEHEVLSGGESDGGRTVKVRAVVSSEKSDCAGRTSLPPAALEDSSVSVRFLGQGPFGDDAANAAESSIRASLAGSGVVVDAKKGDYRVAGTATVFPHRDPRILPFVGARVEMSVRVVSLRDGRVVRESRREAAALDSDGAAAARAAATEAGRGAAADALAALDEAAWLRP